MASARHFRKHIWIVLSGELCKNKLVKDESGDQIVVALDFPTVRRIALENQLWPCCTSAIRDL